MRNENFVTIREYFQKGKFIVPCYQRGYKWSLLKNNNKTHLEQLLDDIYESFHSNYNQDYYLQGVTLKKLNENEFELVDGQQRTTSLYLILLYFKNDKDISNLLFYDNDKKHKLDYKVRSNVKNWINERYSDDKVQDIAAFNAGWKQIKLFFDSDIAKDKKKDLKDYILDHVKLIVIFLDTEPTKVFSMLNQDKAEMNQTELIKAELLSEASRQAFEYLDTREEGTHEWQINHLRSHFAREWDSWLKWWNKEKNFKFYNKALSQIQNEPPVSCLLKLYWEKVKNNNKGIKSIKSEANSTEIKYPFSLIKENVFSEYQFLIRNKKEEIVEAVEVFEGVRELQQILQEWYDDSVIYNWLGLLLRSGIGIENISDLIIRLVTKYQNEKNGFRELLLKYSKWSLLGLDKKDLEDLEKTVISDKSEVCKKRDEIQSNLSSETVYGIHNELAFKQMLRMNIEMSNEVKKKFDFEWYDSERSLEHIQPKSKVIRRDSKLCTDPNQEDNEDVYKYIVEENVDELINKKGIMDLRKSSEGISEHCIGNLVLLDKSDNSAVGTNILPDKINKLFERLKKGSLLLHTFKILSKSFVDSERCDKNWTLKDIGKNKKYFLNNFNECYKSQKK